MPWARRNKAQLCKHGECAACYDVGIVFIHRITRISARERIKHNPFPSPSHSNACTQAFAFLRTLHVKAPPRQSRLFRA